MPDAVESMRAAEAELAGWLHVTNQLLLDGARHALARVEEPAQRTAVQAAYVEGLTVLLHSHAAIVSSALSTATAEAEAEPEVEKTRAAKRELADTEMRQLAQQKLELEQEVAALQKEARRSAEAVSAARLDADAVRSEVVQEQQVLEALRRERRVEVARQREEHERHMSEARQELLQAKEEYAVEERRLQAVRQQLRLLAATLARLRDGDAEAGEESMSYEEPSESLRQIFEKLVEFAEVARRTQQELQEEAAALREQLAAEESMLHHNGLRPLYQRILPPPAVNPVALKLRELRPQGAKTPCGVVNTPRMSNRQPQQHNYYYYYYGHVRGDVAAASSPGSLCQTPNARVPDEVSSLVTAWRERMAALKAELRDLRREIGR
ncbi:hypothetical protein TraAM80_03732 [Trypanosoma rangeli]|uniref:Uncharacterized protein n=1 Tax=Trypanosoma rangeli TaxID=5698 RepID=A0A422NNB9_TRYRA|nr:uncharacterized protein TraAM80_03732 [Trypanosoma rangeli]RNF06916.1 hypothetical protein TraAM80_03732 [Trypanosoma rangeli]|eukprot:RNF06916.1 hypothetical protein TraAM80_03732 [Trypanosoma rangeli]